ncbi:unnamed protein product [Rhizoctonia solani]|uniref:O-methylsterigmatocystin oxidoreductase n=1 Tax=Rhizoctonia solani TaxID=456999 RepID=A0A8H2WWL8_9AGAM|nr:unnamed protein product [Rhizoctonia solani]
MARRIREAPRVCTKRPRMHRSNHLSARIIEGLQSGYIKLVIWYPLGYTLIHLKDYSIRAVDINYYDIVMSETTENYSARFVGLLAVGTVAVILGRYWNWPGSRHKDMPPGPKPLPLLGNFSQLKLVDTFDQFRELNEKHGPLVTLKLGSRNAVLIGGDGILVRELLDKRGAIYSNRPVEIASKLIGRGDHGLFQQDIDKWRAGRKQIVQHYNPRTIKSGYVRIQEAESVQLLRDFLREPRKHMEHCMRYTTSVVMSLNFGIRCPRYDDPAVHEIEEIIDLLTGLQQPGSKPPVEQFPWLWYLPEFMTGYWKTKAEYIGGRLDKFYGALAQIGWERGVNGHNTDNFAYKLRLNEKVHGLTWHQQILACGLTLEAGTDIVAGVISACTLALIHDPEIQRRAWEEIDGLYDEYTLPKWEDEQKMPLVRAIVKETIRWRPPVPLGVPHLLEQDDWYEGHFIPKHTTLICNVWAIHSNPERYENPDLFNPDRFIGHKLSMSQSMVQSDPFKRDHFAFGAGRRSCPGVQIAEQDVFIAVSRLLWAFELSAPPGVQVDVSQKAFIGSIVRRPKEFPLVVKPRSEQRVVTIERELALAEDNMFSSYGLYTGE